MTDDASSTTKPLRHRRRGFIFAAALVLVVVLHAPLLRSVSRLLVVDDPQTGGTLVPVMNDPESLAATAELFRRGGYDRVLVMPVAPRRSDDLGITRSSFAEVLDELAARGVSRDVVGTIPTMAPQRRLRIRAACRYAESRPAERLTLVARRFEGRATQSRVSAELGAAEVRRVAVASQPPAGLDESRWWTVRSAVQQVFQGYLHWADAAWCDDPEVTNTWVDWKRFESALQRGDKP